MNKSKFLKKSLAAILSVLLVVAMIPLSAVAATASVSRISIGDVDGTGSGNEWTVKDIAQGSVVIKVTLANDTGNISVVDRSEVDGASDATPLNAQGVWQFTATDAEVKAGKATFDLVDSADNTTRETYTVNFNFKEGSADVSLKDVLVDTQYGPTAVEGDTYTITLPYGTTSATLKVYPNHASATVTGGTQVGSYFTIAAGAISDGKSTTKVEVKNGSTSHIYTVKTVNAAAFASFSVEGQRKDAKIDTEHKEVIVYMPYGTKASTGTPVTYKVTPTFKKGYEEVNVTLQDVDGSATTTVFESGKEINVNKYFTTGSAADALTSGQRLSGDKKIQLTVKYSDVSAPETWTVKFNGPANDPEPVLKTLSLGTFKATIDETSHTATLNVPKSLRNDATAELKASASDGTKIHLTDVAGVTEQEIDDDDTPKLINADSTPDRKNFPISTKDNFIIRVTAAGDEDGANPAGAGKSLKVQDYKLVINTVDIVGKAEITEMKLEKNDTAKTQYTATIKDNVITFTLPYEVSNDRDGTNAGGVAGWKVYYSLSNGATITTPGSMPVSGFAIDSTTKTVLPATFDGETATSIVVNNTESETTYKIVVKLEKPRNSASLTGVKLTNAEDSTNSSNFGYDDMKDNENTFAATGSKDLVVTIPFSKYGDFTGDVDKAILAGTLAGGAKVYYEDASDSNKLKELQVLTDTNKSVAKDDSGLPDALASGYEFDGRDNSGKPMSLKVVVISEKGATNADGTSKIISGTTTLTALSTSDPGTYTTYTLIVKKADPQKLHALDSISIFDKVTKTKVEGKIQVNDHKITFKLPASFVKAADGSGLSGAIKRDLYLDIGTSHYETVKAYQDEASTAIANNQILNLSKIVYNSDGSYKSGGAQLAMAINAATPKIHLTSSGDGNAYPAGLIRVESEEYVALNGVNGTGGYQNYDIVIEYEPVKKGDTLQSVTINGVKASPDSNKKVTISLPKGTDLTGLRPTFEVSEGAFVSNSSTFTANTSLVQSGDLMNFTQKKTLWVMSEDGANKTQYVLEVKTADGFKDVHESDWFYSYVMQASEMGIVIGSTDGNFYPNNPVTRAQFATMIARTQSDFKKDGTYTNPFSDMNGVTGETLNAVSYCAEKKFITGSGDTTFRPDDFITRQEMAVIIARVRDLDVENVNIGSRFADDSAIAEWAKNYVYACVNANMLLGAGNNTYNPMGITDRASAATVAIRVKNANAK